VYGARPIARKIDQLIKSQLVDELLFGKLKSGGKVEVKIEDGNLLFNFISLKVKNKVKVTV
jgi:ATP-dependent Clp protease ATP-binding subunit ClpA